MKLDDGTVEVPEHRAALLVYNVLNFEVRVVVELQSVPPSGAANRRSRRRAGRTELDSGSRVSGRES